ncbi:MAG: NAD(P)/FAD-dependent oxidoreductase, partial [Verrucomicrobiota bacterium]|nr:NAD(P)/FAD-dependent oxidoreductase [Verrucomicrobiota bacterium]
SGIMREGEDWKVQFEKHSLGAKAVVIALGGASWPETGSDGAWPEILAWQQIEIAPWQPANCGWEVDWPDGFLARVEGKPLKNIIVRAGAESVSGELLITRYGIEGGAIYRLGPILRTMAQPEIEIDLKPQLSEETVRIRLTSGGLKLNEVARAFLEFFPNTEIKKFPLRLRGPRPIAEAISSAGGVSWEELDENLMLRKLPGVFIAGEMIDWEAPTGGYLLQGCFSTGTRAGRCAAQFALS